MDSKARANPHTGVHLQQRHGEPAKGRDRQNKEAPREVRLRRRRQCLLLVPEPTVQISPPPAPDAAAATTTAAATETTTAT